MKRKSTLFIAFFTALLSLGSFHSAHSQIIISLLLGDKLNSGNLEFGVEGGLNRSYLSEINNSKGLNNFHLGFYFDIRLKNDWYVNTGVRVKSNVGASNLSPYPLGDDDLDSVLVDGKVDRKIQYFYVPMHIKYRFARQFFVNAGFQAGLRYRANDLFYSTVYDKDDVVFKYDIRDEIKRLDFGMSGGAGYKFRGTGMNLGITYYYGLVDIMKNPDITSHNSTFYIYVNIPVGAGYKDEKRDEIQ